MVAGARAWIPVVLLAGCALRAQAESLEVRTIMQGTASETQLTIKQASEPGPVVMVIGGVHGNEIAGYKAADRLLDWEILKGTLAVMPRAHQQAIAHNARGYPANMNAMFPGDPHGDEMHRLANAIWKEIKSVRPGLLLTLHESIGFHSRNPDSYGHTLTHDFKEINPLMERALSRVNPDIGPAHHKFVIYVKAFPTCPTYNAWKHLRIPATSIETCMEEPLRLRIKYQLMVVMAFFDEVGLQYREMDVPRLSTVDRAPGTDLSTYAYQITGEARPKPPAPTTPVADEADRPPPPQPIAAPAPNPEPLDPSSRPAYLPWALLFGVSSAAFLSGVFILLVEGRRATRSRRPKRRSAP